MAPQSIRSLLTTTGVTHHRFVLSSVSHLHGTDPSPSASPVDMNLLVAFKSILMVLDDHKSYWGSLGSGNCDLLGRRDSSRSRRDRCSPTPSGLLVRNISLDARSFS
ncbi:hypothetical protein RHSIM_Rhsim10G0120200 [Rhododendron simsii]|uniref:Uncharacterized protein n=1 Tax=Rhododendron simsii TaxID=118357 RepID=A0A834GCX4_RHOSS|nr:hypothetical protein RHSIM_Rhsim10G0120200 [Rhododendron simsii]